MVDRAYEYKLEGNIFISHGQYTEALASYDKAIAITPNDTLLWQNRGAALHKLERYVEALASYDKAIAIDPNVSGLWQNRGAALHKLERYVEALASYNKAIDIDPNHANVWCWRGNALNNLGRYAEAIASCDKAIAIKPDYADAWSYKGNALKELNRYEEAITAYDRAIQLDPKIESAFVGKNELLTKQNEQQNREKKDRKTLIQRIKEVEYFGILPSRLKNTVQQPDTLQYPDEVIATISQLDEFLTTARPQINLVLKCEQVMLDRWEIGKISITNDGSAHAKNVTFELSDDLDVRHVKNVDVPFGETKRLEIQLKAKVSGRIPLDIIVTYSDARDKSYSETFDFDIDVTEKLKVNPQNESALLGKIETPAQIIYNTTNTTYAAPVQIGNSSQTDIKDSLIQRSNIGAEIPIEKKYCPHCDKKIEGNEKFCSQCGLQLRE